MHDLDSNPPPDVDAYAPKLCFCGRRSVASHDYWFCSTECARNDALRALGNPDSHYRSSVRRGIARAAVQELYPRRMMSVDQLRPPNPPPPYIPRPAHPTHLRHGAVAPQPGPQPDKALPPFPTLSEVTGHVLKKGNVGDHSGPPPLSRAHRKKLEEEEFKQLCRDAFTFPEPTPPHTLRRVPGSINGLKKNIRESVATLIHGGRSRKDTATGGSSERVFGHHVNAVIPPARNGSLRTNRLPGPSPLNAESRSSGLRRSKSHAAGWDPVNGKDPLIHFIEEMREEMMSESFDPRSLFNREDSF